MTFDARPLGEQPMRIIPAAISGSKPLALASIKPRVGMMMNWAATPINTAFGALTTVTKSSTLIDVPMPNIMSCINGVINAVNLKPFISMK